MFVSTLLKLKFSFANCGLASLGLFFSWSWDLILSTLSSGSYLWYVWSGVPKAALSMNILGIGDKLPKQRGFFKNNTDDLFTALSFMDGQYNFYNFIIIFPIIKVTMICRRVTYFADLEMIEYYQKMYAWNSKSTKS